MTREMNIYATRQYRREGWGDRLRLTRPRSKRRAFAENGPVDRVSMEMQLRRHDFGLALLLGGGLMVLDRDGPSQGPFAGLTSPMTATSSRGEHLYFRTDALPNNRIKPTVNGTRLDIDLLVNGIICVPPSEMATGKVREWKSGIVPFEALPTMPSELTNLVRIDPMKNRTDTHDVKELPDDKKIASARRALARRVSVAGQNGDLELFRAACLLVQFYRLDLPTAHALLSEWNAGGNCQPPWDEKRLVYKLTQAWKLRR